MHPTMNTFLAAALASSSVALHAHAMQEVPPVRPVAPPPPSNSLVSAPAPGSTAVSLQPQTETWVLNSPVPTVSPSWGYRATVMGDRVFVGGPERAVSPGACGQLCMWERVNGEWKADPNLFQVERVGTGAFVLQRLERGGHRARHRRGDRDDQPDEQGLEHDVDQRNGRCDIRGTALICRAADEQRAEQGAVAGKHRNAGNDFVPARRLVWLRDPRAGLPNAEQPKAIAI
jgi:hypothetical protein